MADEMNKSTIQASFILKCDVNVASVFQLEHSQYVIIHLCIHILLLYVIGDRLLMRINYSGSADGASNSIGESHTNKCTPC